MSYFVPVERKILINNLIKYDKSFNFWLQWIKFLYYLMESDV